MGRKKHDEEGGAGEGWLISYCDMVSLLVTFFLMMLTFSTKDSGQVADVGVGILKGKGGVLSKLTGLSVYEPLDADQIHELALDLKAASLAGGEASDMGIQGTLDGLSLRFNEHCAFPPGSAEPSAELRANLERLGPILARFRLLCVVEGFTDDAVKATPEFPDARALACARAAAAADTLRAAGGLPADLVQLAGFGVERSRSTNATALGRSLNRRVEIRLLALASSGGARD